MFLNILRSSASNVLKMFLNIQLFQKGLSKSMIDNEIERNFGYSHNE